MMLEPTDHTIDHTIGGFPAVADSSAFISYRRGDGYPWARLIWDELQTRNVNAFLDLESMRQAGRFDTRILNQIAARPYFLMVLTERSLDRCVSETDWVRREIEHALETERIIVPLFIAPFEVSKFPPGLPPRITEALANSNGVTFYSQFLAAALDQLAGFLQPVAMPGADLTDDDAEFEEHAISQVRSEPPPIVPLTPAIGERDPSTQPAPDAEAQPVVPDTEAQPVVPDAEAQPVVPDAEAQPVVPDEAVPSAVAHVVDPAPPLGDVPTPSSSAEMSPPTTGEVPVAGSADSPPDHPVVAPVVPNPTPRSKIWAIVAVAAVVLLLIAFAAVNVFSGGDGDGDVTSQTGAPESEASTTEQGDDDDRVTTTVTTTTVGDDVVPSRREAETWMDAGESIASEGGRFQLVMQPNGRLELLDGASVLWEPDYLDGGARVQPNSSLRIQADGNLVIYPSKTQTGPADAIAQTRAPLPPDAPRVAELRIVAEGDWAYVEMIDTVGDQIWRSEGPPSADADADADADDGTDGDDIHHDEDTATSTTVGTTTSSPSSSLAPTTADVELSGHSVDRSGSILELSFVNHGDADGTVDLVELIVTSATLSRAVVPVRGSPIAYDVAIDPRVGAACSFDPGWDPIEATGQPVTRRVRFGMPPQGLRSGATLEIEASVSGDDVRESQRFQQTVELDEVSTEQPSTSC